MFSQIHNVVSGRDLYSSNPCRDFWDSQQFSQVASGSQSSQQSSVELFSQPKCSQSQEQQQSQQQRISTSYDWWSNTGENSQEANEDGPLKYYMKYLSKPPIFFEQCKKDQEKSQTENFKEFFEIQKTKTLERDQRDLLDIFVSLLKEYTKEVQTAMQSFEASLDNSLSRGNINFEKMSSVAEMSFNVVEELKNDFDCRFAQLRKELKDNEELKAIISKKEQELSKMETENKLQKEQIEDLKKMGNDALIKEEKAKLREEQLLEKIKEAERQVMLRDTPPPSQHQDLQVLQRSGKNSLKPGKPVSNPGFSRKDIVTSYQDIACPSIQRTSSDDKMLEQFRVKNTSTGLISQDDTAAAYPHSQSTFKRCYGSSFIENNESKCICHNFTTLSNSVQCSVIQTADKATSISESSASVYPFPPDPLSSASLNPVQISDTSTQCIRLGRSCSTGERQVSSSTLFPITIVSPTIRSAVNPKQLETIPSPANRLPVLAKDKWPKYSPVATVLPQIQVRPQVTSQDRFLDQHKKRQEDPLGIFTFDLTASPPLENYDNDCQRDLEPKIKQEEIEQLQVTKKPPAPKRRQTKATGIPPRNYGTRSRGKIEEDINKIKKAVMKVSSTKPSSANQSDGSCSKTVVRLKRRVCNTVVASSRKKCNIGIKASVNSDAKEFDPKIRDSLEPQVSQEISRIPFKRQKLDKRTLNVAGSALFESMDEDISIQKITESIRKHAQKRKLIRKKYRT